MTKSKNLEIEIEKIKERNKRVEADKAWETSWTRKFLLLILTYFVVLVFFLFTGLPNPYVNSLVPAVAFFLSTLTIGLIKKLWLKYVYKR